MASDFQEGDITKAWRIEKSGMNNGKKKSKGEIKSNISKVE